METQEFSEGKIRPEIQQTIDFAQKIISGEYGINFPDGSLDPSKTFTGPIYDTNDPNLTKEERAFLENWIEEKLGSTPEESPVRTKFTSSDGITEVVVFDIELGNNWYLSRWQNKWEGPFYVFWPDEVYEWQLEDRMFRKVNLD